MKSANRQVTIFMIARNEERIAKAHVCLTCFQLAETGDFDAIIESVSLQDFREVHGSPELGPG